MNSVQASKEWQISQPPMQSPLIGESPIVNSSHPSNYSPTSSMSNPQAYPYTHNSMMHPPLQPYPQQQPPPPGSITANAPSSYIDANTRNESDPRLPGMMVLSQPGTPRPNSVISDDDSPNSKKARHSYVSSFSSMPYPVMPRKRSRNDNSLFPAETGPSFSAAKPLDNLYAPDRTNLLTVRVQSKMDRGFFLADNDWTCYRRNYFQVSSTFGIHGINHYYGEHELQCFVQTARHGLQPVSRFVLGISARVSNSDKHIDLVQHTPKRDKGPQMTPVAKTIAPGGNLSLSSVGNTQNIATFERIQFKTATANNGKRRAAQQYYVVVVELFAETHEGERVSVASSLSSPLVVRGRSPGHYADSNQERTPSNASATTMMAASGANEDERYTHYLKPPVTPPSAAMMPNGMGPGPDYGAPPYGYYNAYPTGPFPHGMMVPSPHLPLPTPTSSSSTHPANTGANNGSSSSTTTNSSSSSSSAPAEPVTAGPPLPPPSTNGHQPYMVHSMSEPSSSESSSPDLYQAAPGGPDYSIHHAGKPHPSHLNIHSLPMHSADGPHGEWSRSRYHSAGSVPSPSIDHHQASYFSQQQQQQHHAPHQSQHHHATNGAPPTPTTPFSARKYDTMPSTEHQQQTS
ncbi:hypothetical protein BCR42DRAFT_423288 [Absidia repens]|uniref:NDT80 domain-containing protein n=1 Tax=Absidia repens TaxID=90262 RepID=A0A1X2I5L7_9FUNG|nr:hypothetical protein BCR42DRAFT_423288 [Absidia repens]